MSARSIWTFLPTVPLVGNVEVVVVGVDVGEVGADVGDRSGVVVDRAWIASADRRLEPVEREAERLDGALQPLQQVDRHQLLDALLAAGLRRGWRVCPPM